MENKKLKVSIDLNGEDCTARNQRKIIHYDDEKDSVDKKDVVVKTKVVVKKEVVVKKDVVVVEDELMKRKIPTNTPPPPSPTWTAALDSQVLSLFLSLSSNDHQSRLEAFKKLESLKAPVMRKELKTVVFKVIANEMVKETGPIDIRLEALKILNGLPLNKVELKTTTVCLLRLSYRDPSYLIRCEALRTLNRVINQAAPFNWQHLTGLLAPVPTETFNPARYDHLKDPHDILSALPRTFQPNEAVFAVLSHVAANDTHYQVRVVAMDLFAKIPGRICGGLVGQSVKKDHYWVDDKNKKNSNSNSTKSMSDKYPLLCCGVFAHGIEDQFVQIRFSALKSLFCTLQSSLHKSADIVHLSVFLDALLDECDLIRLTALKLLGRLGDLPLTINFGLESLLAVLDDRNMEIREEALKLLQNNLTIPLTLTDTQLINETMLRSLRCLEAALMKYPEMEQSALESALKMMSRLGRAGVMKKCPQFHAALMQTDNPKYLTPPSILGVCVSNSHSGSGISSGNSHSTASTLQLVMQIPFLKDKTAAKIRLVKLASRLPSSPLTFLKEFREYYSADIVSESESESDDVMYDGKEMQVESHVDREQIELFKRVVQSKT